MRESSASIGRCRLPDVSGGFTLTELLVVMLVAGILLAGFTGFYLSEQRAVRHHQIEIESSQELRIALEQMSRNIRAAKKDLTRDYLTATGGAGASFFPAGDCAGAQATCIDFTIDEDDDADTTDPGEHKGYRLNGTTVQSLDSSGDWDGNELAENIVVSGACNNKMFTYFDSTGAEITNPTSSSSIKSVGICITTQRATVGGLPVSRTEFETVDLRNVK